MSSWNPGEYLLFQDERTRPAHDLCARIQSVSPRRVLDLGCGPGNSTMVLRERWPKAEVTGLDSSPEMIGQARAAHPEGTWVLADLAGFRPEAPSNVVFSNAALQWLPDQGRVVPGLMGLVAPGGCLAVQVPAEGGSPFRAALQAVARSGRWREAMAGAQGGLNFQDARFYYDLLAPVTSRLDLWETIYYHLLPSRQALLDWYRSTGMRPYLDRLAQPCDREAFQQEVLEACRADYVAGPDGKVVMPFRRIFFVAWK